MKRSPLVWLSIKWPREVGEDQVLAVWRRLPAIAGWPLIIEAIGQGGQVRHRMAVLASREKLITRQLRAEIPGIGIEPDGPEPLKALQLAAELRFSTRRRAVTVTDLGSASRALLTTLSLAGPDEVLLIQWVLGRPLHPQATPSGNDPLPAESWLRFTAEAFLQPPRQPDSEPIRAWSTKRAEPGWRASGRLGVRAQLPKRQSLLMHQLAAAVRSLESPGLQLDVRRRRPTAIQRAAIPWLWPLRLNAVEAAALSTWPVGETRALPVDALTSRPMPPAREIPSTGRVVGTATYPGLTRPLALSVTASLRHLHLLGPSGSGKSTIMLNLIAQDLQAGHGVVVIEPKGDLITDILGRVPDHRINDIVLLDPLDGDRPVGFNPLVAMGRSSELVADQLLSTLRDLSAGFGPLTQDVFAAALLTLTQVPGMTLVAIPVLLTNPTFRRRILSQVHDPAGLDQFWASFEASSESAKASAVAPVLRRLRPFLLRPALRRLVGQAEPKADIRQVFTRQRVLLVNLAKGQLGPEVAALLGSLVVSQLWQATLSRSTVPAEKRRPVFMYLDEFQDFLRLPLDLGDALVQARGLGLSLTMAHQHLAQLTTELRAGLEANAQSKVVMRLAPNDARVMAAGSPLAPEDFSGLGAYECYAQLLGDNAVRPWASARSQAPPEIISDPDVVREASRQNYGRDRAEVDEAIDQLIGVGQNNSGDADDLAPRRRRQP